MNIYALSSGRGPSGIAIVRVSGKDILKVCMNLTKLKEITKPYSDMEMLHMLVDDLFWEQDRMTSSGVDGLNNLANFVDEIKSLTMKGK